MNASRLTPTCLLLALLSGAVPALAADAPAPPGAEAAALENQATAMESEIDKDCQKVAREARPLCRQQHAQAVQRVRARAARLR